LSIPSHGSIKSGQDSHGQWNKFVFRLFIFIALCGYMYVSLAIMMRHVSGMAPQQQQPEHVVA